MDLFNKDCLPEYIRTQKHDDWITGLRWVPRIWTAWVMYLPTYKWIGNQDYSWIEFSPQACWPITPDSEVKEIEDRKYIKVVEPVPKNNHEWSVQSYYIGFLRRRIPAYFCIKFNLLGIWPWFFSIGLKPDYDPGKWNTTFPEISFTRS